LTAFDLVMMGIVVFSILISLQRGFVREALSLAAWVAAVILSRWYGNLFADLLSTSVPSAAIRVPLGHFLVFFLVIISGSIIGYLMKSMLKAVGLSLVDRLLGC
jgi:membrane protein required for colicin V production